MYYKIIDIKTVQSTGVLYALVHFWKTKNKFDKGDPPDIINDFYMAVEATREVVERDAQGNLITESGAVIPDDTPENPLDKYKKKTEDVDVSGFVEKCIEKFIARAIAKDYKGDLTDKSAKLTDSDPKGVKVKVEDLKLKEKDVNI